MKKKAVDLFHQNKNYAAVSRELNTHRKNIQRWVKQFSEDGMVGLREKCGRKSG
ncbi:helix-turn-helix domain-containing protein [Peribacillus sp. Hz7]|uniref:helix-turn-helix domain-containing protein n=1 Tax=Peribacillus sp. Hz7 TaxID=3344873 RepID=UPI0035C95D39